MNIKIGMISLGCPKNRVDAEMMLHSLKEYGYEITPNESDADVIIVNTCGFIEDAKRESIETIVETAKLKTEGNLKAIIVTGCMAERYRDEILKELPEVDAVVGIGKNGEIAQIINSALKKHGQGFYAEKTCLDINAERFLTTPSYTAYLKIAEGCNNCCTYCAIPQIRGKFRSRTKESIIKEAEKLAKNGVKELVLVAQDTTRYGEDIYGVCELPSLIKDLAKIDGIAFIRTLYSYPERITDELLKTVAEEPKAVKYFDLPIQHCNAEILKRMNRVGDRETLTALIKKIRKVISGVVIRTTLITGFPGETEQQFSELCEFVREIKFDRLGCFAYSEEENTPAASFPDQIPMQTRVDRAEIIMNDQMTISENLNREKIGKSYEVLVEGYDNYIKCYFGRSYMDAPDIDGKVFFKSMEKLSEGSIVKVKINDIIEYDLLGEKE